jgi:RHS repeat-associated protein
MVQAARLGDPIAHTGALTGFLVGAVIGIALIALVAAATLSCGFLLPLLAGLASAGAAAGILWLSEAIGASLSTPSGAIITGSPDVFINGRTAARAKVDTAVCDKHPPVLRIAEGSATVFINGLPAARKNDAIVCGAKINGGSKNVFIGGGTSRLLPVADEVPLSLRKKVEIAFMAAGLVGGLAGLLKNGISRALAPCAAKFIAGFMVGEAIGQYVVAPVVQRAMGGLFGHPVDVTTGRKLLLGQEEIDFVLPSPLPFECSRFYASNLAHQGGLGKGWVLPWDLRLQPRNGQVWFTDSQGRESGFPVMQPGQAAFSDTEQCYLSCAGDGRYILYDLNDTFYDFGHLDPGTETVAWVRRVEDRTGQWHNYQRDADHRVTAIETSGGQRLQLHYAGPRLTGIERAEGGSPGLLVSYGFDQFGQLASVTDANGALVRQFEYTGGLMTSHTNALGLRCSYQWAEIEGQPRVTACSTSEGEEARFRYDPAGRQTWVEDELGRKAHWSYDEHFQVIACTDLDGSQYRIDYNDAGQPVALQLPGGRQVAFEYDYAGRIVAETDPLGRVTYTGYDGNSLRVAELTLPDGGRWQATYDYFGRLLETLDPVGRSERYEYGDGPAPQPLVHIDARGGRQHMAWDRRGQLTAYTDCSGKTTHYEYNDDGQLAAVTDALGQITRYQRRRTGEPVLVTLPDGSTEKFKYDAAGLLIEQQARGREQRWLRNSRGQVVDATDPAQRHLRYRYDTQGRLVELVSDTDTRYRFAYDNGDRLVREVRPDGVERHLRYDGAGELLALETLGAAAGGETGAERLRRAMRFERDKMGRLLAQTTATALTSYTWDDGDRVLVAERIPSAAGVALGILPNSVRLAYDTAGRLVAEHGADGTVNYTLDELDNVTSLGLPHGPGIDTLAYGSGHVHQIRSGQRVISDFERDDLHREVQRTQGWLTQRTGYDLLGRRTWHAAGTAADAVGPGQGRLWRSYRYHWSGELAQLKDSVRGAIEFGYDPAGNLLNQTRTAEGSQERFAWDAAGNLLNEVSRKSRGHVAGNRLRVWQDLRFEYDPWGNLSEKRKGAHQEQRFSFDAEDRLIAVVTRTPQGTVESRFDYDALGRRIGSTETRSAEYGSARTERKRFVWQGLRMVQEVRDTGFSTYVYSPDEDYTPLARIDAAIGTAIAGAAIETARASSRVYYFHTDLVGTPLEVTDEAGELAWAGKYSAWGKVDLGEDAALLPRTEQPLRYPGQYADQGTGLHYNTFRYYDPDIGRFINQDPIGLDGGQNLYQYAPNPLRWIDPWGWVNLNTNGATGHFGVYEILVDGKVYKYGKADLNRVTKSSGLPTRLHQQDHKLAEALGRDRVESRVIESGHRTTAAAKTAETAKLKAHHDAGGKVPLGNQKSFKPKPKAGC